MRLSIVRIPLSYPRVVLRPDDDQIRENQLGGRISRENSIEINLRALCISSANDFGRLEAPSSYFLPAG